MRAGIALPVVLLMLALTSALVVGGAFVTRQQIVVSRDRARGGQLEFAAEQAAIDAVARWDSAARAAQPTGVTIRLASAHMEDFPAEAWVTRIGSRTYWVVAESRSDTRPPLTRRIGLVVRVVSGVPQPVPERAWSELP